MSFGTFDVRAGAEGTIPLGGSVNLGTLLAALPTDEIGWLLQLDNLGDSLVGLQAVGTATSTSPFEFAAETLSAPVGPFRRADFASYELVSPSATGDIDFVMVPRSTRLDFALEVGR